jgi:hypothetical protein
VPPLLKLLVAVSERGPRRTEATHDPGAGKSGKHRMVEVVAALFDGASVSSVAPSDRPVALAAAAGQVRLLGAAAVMTIP